MSTRLIIEGNAVYEIDEDCQACGRKYGQNTTVRTESCKKDKEEKSSCKNEER